MTDTNTAAIARAARLDDNAYRRYTRAGKTEAALIAYRAAAHAIDAELKFALYGE